MNLSATFLIAKQVWRAAFNNKAILVLIFILACLLAFGAYSGVKVYKAQQSVRTAYEQQVRENWENNPDKHPHRMAHYGYIAFRPKHPLSFFDFGMESYTGNAVFLEAHKQNTINFSEASFSTGLLRFGEISMAMVLQILVPLLIFFIGFNLVAGERETSTLKVLHTQGAGWKEIIAGKTLGLAAIVLILFIPAILLAIVFWISQVDIPISGDDLSRIVWLIVAYLVYFGVLCAIAVIVSAICKTSKIALVTLIGIWLIFNIILPRATQAIGSHLYPAPSKIEFETAVEKELIQKGDSHNPDDPYYRHLKDSVLRAHNVTTVEGLPFNYSGFQMKEGEKISSEIYNKHLSLLLNTYQKQNDVSKFTAFISPYMAIKSISMALSGTDFNSFIAFQNQAEDYRYQLAQYMNDLQIKLISNKKLGENDKGYTISKEYWKTMPDYNFQPISWNMIFKNEIISVMALLFWISLLFVLVKVLSKKLNVL